MGGIVRRRHHDAGAAGAAGRAAEPWRERARVGPWPASTGLAINADGSVAIVPKVNAGQYAEARGVPRTAATNLSPDAAKSMRLGKQGPTRC